MPFFRHYPCWPYQTKGTTRNRSRQTREKVGHRRAGRTKPLWRRTCPLAPVHQSRHQERSPRQHIAFTPMDASGEGTQPVHRVFLIQPLVVIDERSGRARVQKLVAEASGTLAELKTFDAQKLRKELRMRHTKIAHTGLSTFRPQTGIHEGTVVDCVRCTYVARVRYGSRRVLIQCPFIVAHSI
ncbi:hypothetical protein C8F04DRAFT_1138255, partial [Mycena alexandri]